MPRPGTSMRLVPGGRAIIPPEVCVIRCAVPVPDLAHQIGIAIASDVPDRGVVPSGIVFMNHPGNKCRWRAADLIPDHAAFLQSPRLHRQLSAGFHVQRVVEAEGPWERGEVCCLLGGMHSRFGGILLTRDLDGGAPYLDLDPLMPVPRKHIEKAAARTGVPPPRTSMPKSRHCRPSWAGTSPRASRQAGTAGVRLASGSIRALACAGGRPRPPDSAFVWFSSAGCPAWIPQSSPRGRVELHPGAGALPNGRKIRIDARWKTRIFAS